VGLRAASRAALFVVAVLPLLLAPPRAGAATAHPPRSFFGIVPQGSLGPGDFARMRGVVGTLRVPVLWAQVEPRRGERDFTGLDQLVADAAAARVRVLPFVYGTPSWLAADPALPPLDSAGRRAWATFLRALVRRYGPGGDFWRGTSSPLPIRYWQIWNEPNFVLFWRPRPSPGGYARLLRVAAHSIRGVDPGARIVAAGVAPVEAGMLPWTFLRRLLAIPGAGRQLDLVAVHPYAFRVSDVALQVRLARRAMARAGEGDKPLLVSEFGVASDSRLPTDFDRGLSGQATYLRNVFRLLLRNRRRWHVAGADWYAWQDGPAFDPHCVFCQYAGLFDAAGEPKPAWWAFASVAAGARVGTVR